MKSFVAAMLLVIVGFVSYAQAEAWYQLEADETYVSDFVLAAGAVKEVSVDSPVAREVGFRTDVGGVEDYRALQAKYGTDVIELRNISKDFKLTTVSGGSLEVQPTEGKLLVSIKNLTDKEFKVVVFTRPIVED